MMGIDPLLPKLVGFALIIIVTGILMQLLKQPNVIGYILVGIFLGPSVLGVVQDELLLHHLGAIGVVLLLFFAGMEVSLKDLFSRWRITILGTLGQILLSIAIVWGIGVWLDWKVARIILLGFAISLSSTAVVLKLLGDWKEMKTQTGKDVVGILLVQDILIVPMIIVLAFLAGHKPSAQEIGLQIIGGILVFALLGWILSGRQVRLPFQKVLRRDHDLQVFVALFLCLGFALVTGMTGLSTALGAFVAGLVVSAAKGTQWVHESAHPFRVVFIALFFVSVGMLIDLSFVSSNLLIIGILVLFVLLTNTFINAGILRLLGGGWRKSLYAGSILSQIGEFSFVLAAIGLQGGIIGEFGYQTTISVIAVTLLISPLWIFGMKRVTRTIVSRTI